MSAQTNTPDLSKEELIEFFEWKIRSVTEKYNADIRALQARLNEVKGINGSKPINNGRDLFQEGVSIEQAEQRKTREGGSWKEKISDALKHFGKPTRSAEIFEYLKQVDEFTKKKPDSAFKSITSVLSVNAKDGGIYKKETVNGVNLYSMA